MKLESMMAVNGTYFWAFKSIHIEPAANTIFSYEVGPPEVFIAADDLMRTTRLMLINKYEKFS